MNKTTRKKLNTAIENKNKIDIVYKDDPKSRTIYPHIIYKNSIKSEILDAYQVSGYSSTSSASTFPSWKQFLVSEIKSIELLPENFVIVKSFNKESPRYKDVIKIIK